MFTFLLLFTITFSPLNAGQQAYQQGDYETAIRQWQLALTTTNKHEFIEITLQIAKAYRQLGGYQQATNLLDNTITPLSELDDIPLKIKFYNEFSKLYSAKDKEAIGKAELYNEQALELARQYTDSLLLAEVLNQTANIASMNLDYETALKTYAEAVAVLNQYPNNPLTNEIKAKILINQAQRQFLLDKDNVISDELKETQFASSIQALEQALPNVHDWTDIYSEVFAKITLGKLAQSLFETLPTTAPQRPRLYQQAYQLLYQAQQMSNPLNAQAQSYAQGSLGELYQAVGQYEDATQLIRQAVFHAQTTQEKTLIYKWLWRLGQLLRQQNNLPEAIAVYRQAINTFTPIQQQIATKGYCAITENIRAQVATVYFELADLLLQQAKQSTGQQQQYYLSEARQAVETYKNFELQDYYQDNCITQHAECTSADQLIDAHTAILYLIPLPERLELLLTTATGIHQATIAVDEKTLKNSILGFSSPLRDQPSAERRTRATQPDLETVQCNPLRHTHPDTPILLPNQNFFTHAQQLYDWLINPFLPQLQDIETLVIIPEGLLRTVPFAALHDGQHYLIERFALAITPSLCLNASTPPHKNYKMLLSGLSESVQNFSALPCARYEVETLKQTYPDATLLLNKDFIYPKLSQILNLGDFSIVHIASHGQFSSNVHKTFVLSYEEKLNLNRLSELMILARVKDNPLELLTLSACETGLSDDRAALGLAGVALKAGVKSAVATLWKVDDEATPLVLLEFYAQLQQAKLSKAKALQMAQKRLLSDEQYRDYRHPYYWAAFLLIGNWL
ncbi:hypothetical protein BegalDRAFT_2148 [Beggiatoa alba B18LD]|uniref:CHAT domain-containing protein n=1 Tax=Beggiatoa alba B18LD TaxID=395493 RepID=I3CHB9_9GAMM|nr:CHAT domain-containing protein [Beggiatoa alba]EIJ43012.1 hypothetical protein BegalDRAFT_2148 [Beggiatoa alba B18LD]